MRRPRVLKESGPYRVRSYSQNGNGTVFLVVEPKFPDYGEDWFKTRSQGEGGGPGIITVMNLARHLAEYLNAPYAPEEVKAWESATANQSHVKVSSQASPTKKRRKQEEA